ncbi:hypothetical protein [Paenibacillus aceris]|uniref:DUF4367 domain-containing protein n=1 Tax=Paenibacillus aceris TaxID=869555 RepID=A0ABS4I9C8_9BACL|nr:hypothetical protein [Paenibacillus aceris]MBP1967540.1 hypothetical protein [Paenibacillus aceris]
MRRVTLQLILLTLMSLTLFGCEGSPQQKDAVSGDKLYIPEGYKTQLTSLKLTEAVSLPYFTKPFICVAKDQEQQQFAVVFYTESKIKTVKLLISYEEVIKRIESKGFNIKIGTTSLQNLHLFEINNELYWNFEDGTGKIYLNLQGEVVTDPFKTKIAA